MRPVHKLKPTKSVVAFTWCGVDPYRKGVLTLSERDRLASKQPTCRDCIREELKSQSPQALPAREAR